MTADPPSHPTRFGKERTVRAPCLSLIDRLDSRHVPSTFELGGQKNLDDLLGHVEANDSLSHGDTVGVIVRPREKGSFLVEAIATATTFDAVSHDGFSIAAAAQHDPALDFAVSDSHGAGADPLGIIGSFVTETTVVYDLVAQRTQPCTQCFFILKPAWSEAIPIFMMTPQW